MKTINTSSFIKKAKIIHGEKYIYDNFIYSKAKVKSTIICRQHGEFQQSPDHHLRGQGCNKCSGNEIRDKDFFVKKSIKKHGELYIYDKVEYVNRNQKVEIICKKHGSFFQSPFNHYAGKGCEKCNGEKISNRCRKKFKDFLKDAVSIHGDKYVYLEETYSTAIRKITLSCKIHGDFKVTPNKHLSSKRGCPQCSRENMKNNTWSYSKYDELCSINHNGISSIYLISCHGNNENFYKVGVTAYLLSERFAGNRIPYEYREITTIKGSPIWFLQKEREIHKQLDSYKYRPKNRFCGHTECFSELTPEVLDFFGVNYAA